MPVEAYGQHSAAIWQSQPHRSRLARRGAPALNQQGVPLTAGMIRLNLVGDETRYAYPGIYLDGKKACSCVARRVRLVIEATDESSWCRDWLSP